MQQSYAKSSQIRLSSYGFYYQPTFLSKTIDRLWHYGLLSKLEMSGIFGLILVLLSSFLSSRRQHILLNGKSLEWKMASSGVPQGSVLGPLFFLVLINDLVDSVHGDITLFADYTSLFLL